MLSLESSSSFFKRFNCILVFYYVLSFRLLSRSLTLFMRFEYCSVDVLSFELISLVNLMISSCLLWLILSS